MIKKSWKSNECHAGLEYFIDEIDPHQDTSRSGKVNRAIVKAKNLSDDDWKKLMKELKLFKKNELSQIDVQTPTAMQVKIEEELESDLEIIEENIKRALELKTLQTQFEIQLLWLNYLNCLKEETMNVGESSKPKDKNLTGPDIVKKIVQIILLNRDKDKKVIEKIKNILLEWEE
ncbi:hypothetical protein ACHAL6_03155 [Proteiniclasticum sp. C24MP]|uniref:hypothetical protein n=1 Tax=Proteiniclasticum sp. C24MP TaxID=3374101 RepID=UPI003754CAE1